MTCQKVPFVGAQAAFGSYHGQKGLVRGSRRQPGSRDLFCSGGVGGEGVFRRLPIRIFRGVCHPEIGIRSGTLLEDGPERAFGSHREGMQTPALE
jgi:hypothetical protein